MASGSGARPFDGVQRYLLLAEELRQAERRAATFRVASAIGHLIGTPLNVIAGRAALIRATPDSGNPGEHARKIEEQVERLSHEVRRLIDYLTPLEPVREAVSVASVVEDVRSLCDPIAESCGIEFSLPDSAPDASVEGTSTLFVLTSLMSLAARRSKRGTAVKLGVVSEAKDKSVTFQIVAKGMEHPRGRIDRLEPPDPPVDPHADSMQALSICFAVAQRHGGSVLVTRDAEKATMLSFECVRFG
jgi:two-component system, NtrC family, sensor kinase